VREDRHREGGKSSSDRSRPDLVFREGQTLTHELDFPPLAGEIKFLQRRSLAPNFASDNDDMDRILRPA
jgi:hypothetical protein